ncbi:MAG: hypothetical protein IT372_25400 [Polyangiaceae bacterium]|nr:hypothetical protein [Polyangiaceae bacterium]
MIDAPRSNRYERLTSILERYITRSTAGAMLKNVISDRGLEQERLSAEDLAAVIEDVMIGLRLFCNPGRLPDLMIELAELCDSEGEGDEDPPSQRPSRPLDAKPGCT